MSQSENEIEIDGSFGEGGGQILRTSLALSLLTGKPIRLYNIRARRSRPGLARQHLTAVLAAQRVGEAKVSGAEIGSRDLHFEPHTLVTGELDFDIGTAGSVSLVLQTVLPALMRAEGTSVLRLTGGTHNPMAPPYEFLAKTFAPAVTRLGTQIDCRLLRHGFYPVGEGRVELTIAPQRELTPFDWIETGDLKSRKATAFLSQLPNHIANRELDVLKSASGWARRDFAVEVIENAAGPGNYISIELQFETGTEVVTGIGRKGVAAEKVARDAWREADMLLKAEVPVGEHMADQWMLMLAIAVLVRGSRAAYRTLPLSGHSETHREIIQRFLPVAIEQETVSERAVNVIVEAK